MKLKNRFFFGLLLSVVLLMPVLQACNSPEITVFQSANTENLIPKKRLFNVAFYTNVGNAEYFDTISLAGFSDIPALFESDNQGIRDVNSLGSTYHRPVLIDDVPFYIFDCYPEAIRYLRKEFRPFTEAATSGTSLLLVSVEGSEKLSQEAAECCLAEIGKYVYAFPGSIYLRMSVFIRIVTISEETVQLDIEGFGDDLDGQLKVATPGDNDDAYHFEMEYDQVTGQCEIIAATITAKSLSQEVNLKALELLHEHPVVREYVDNSGYHGFEFKGWFDSRRKEFSSSEEFLVIKEFSDPSMGILHYYMRDVEQHELHIYVDPFNGEVITIDEKE